MAPSVSFRKPSTFKIDRKAFDLGTDEGLLEFRVRAARLIEQGSSARTGGLGKKEIRGLREIVRLAERLSEESDEEQRLNIKWQISEVAAAIANNRRPVIPGYVGLPDLPFRFFDSLSNPVGKGGKQAVNLGSGGENSDASWLDPERSTFWRRPQSIRAADLFAGFGRTSLPRFDEEIWNYGGPKTTGGNPGCKAVAGSVRIKVKFSEAHCEPFVSRVFHALGFHVDPTDYTRRLKLRYDRRYFQEFQRLPELKMKIGLFFIPVHTFHFERDYDPFDFIAEAVLKDGTRVSRNALARMLLRDTKARDRFGGANFNSEFEGAIDHLVTSEANIQIEKDSSGSIGPWAFDDLGHEDLREVRGAGVLAAWLGWWDARFENTRLRVVETAEGTTLRHYFSDLGAGLGRAAGTYSHSSEEVADFSPTFTRGYRRFGEWRIEFPEYEPIEDNAAFKEITIADARWMARLIAQLSEAQIREALVASGFGSEEVAVYTERLVSRRDQLLRDTRLMEEFSMLGSEPRLAGKHQALIR